MVIVPGKYNQNLATEVANGLNLAKLSIQYDNFPNRESRIFIEDIDKVANEDIVIISSTGIEPNDAIIELCFVIDAIKSATPKSISCVIPWFGYSPQDKIFRPGEPLSARVMAKILNTTEVEKFLVIDVHSELALSNFNHKPENIIPVASIKNYLMQNFIDLLANSIVLSPDSGSRIRAKQFADNLQLEVLYLDKNRDRATGVVSFVDYRGDLEGKVVFTFDDFTSTGSTLIKSAKILKDNGAGKIVCCVSHLVTEQALNNILDSEIDYLVTTNSLDWDIAPQIATSGKLHIADISSEIISWLRSSHKSS